MCVCVLLFNIELMKVLKFDQCIWEKSMKRYKFTWTGIIKSSNLFDMHFIWLKIFVWLPLAIVEEPAKPYTYIHTYLFVQFKTASLVMFLSRVGQQMKQLTSMWLLVVVCWLSFGFILLFFLLLLAWVKVFFRLPEVSLQLLLFTLLLLTVIRMFIFIIHSLFTLHTSSMKPIFQYSFNFFL